MKSIILISLVAVLCTTAHAQDPVKTSPQYYKVLLENDQVRVLEYRLKAGEKEPIHSHSAGVDMCPPARYLSLVIQTAERKRELLLPGRRFGVIRQHTRWRISAIPKPMPSLSISNLLDHTSPLDYMTTDHKLPTSGPLTSVLQPSRKATAWPADP